MHRNLETRFINLAVRQSAYQTAFEMFRSRYHLLFNALADDMGLSRDELGAMVGFAPVPPGGNLVMSGAAAASDEDVAKLLNLYLGHNGRAK